RGCALHAAHAGRASVGLPSHPGAAGPGARAARPDARRGRRRAGRPARTVLEPQRPAEPRDVTGRSRARWQHGAVQPGRQLLRERAPRLRVLTGRAALHELRGRNCLPPGAARDLQLRRLPAEPVVRADDHAQRTGHARDRELGPDADPDRPAELALPPCPQAEVLVAARVAHPAAARPRVDGPQRVPGNGSAVVPLDRHRLAGATTRDRTAEKERHGVFGDRVIRVDRDGVAGRARGADERCHEEERCESSQRMDGTAAYASNLPSRTEEIAAALAASLTPGDVVTVSGELGTGKTTFVRGASRALGGEGAVT